LHLNLAQLVGLQRGFTAAFKLPEASNEKISEEYLLFAGFWLSISDENTLAPDSVLSAL